MIKRFKNWIKARIKIILIFIGFIGICFAGDEPFKNEVSLEKLNTKYNASQEIKAKYSLNGTSLVKQDIKNSEPDKYLNEPKDEVKITIGDNEPVLKGGLLGGSTTTEFKPNIELKRWNEVGFKIKTDKLLEGVATKDKDLKFDKDKIRFDTPKISFEMYDYAEGEGGYKFIWYLNEKPTTNKVEFQIESSGLDFFYQPPLTQEYQNGYSEEFQREIVVSETQVKDLEGNVLVERPENVVGSYAVYHQTKGGMNDINGKEYKTGKAFHIYRPHIIDATGAETWGILHIENGIYSVEIPQDFLDTAVYPIKSNDTFGYGTQGASEQAIANSGFGTPQVNRAGSVFAPSSSGTLDNIKFYGRLPTGTPGETVDTTVWVNTKDSGGSGTHGQVATAESLNETYDADTAPMELHTINLGSENITASTNYIINVVGDGADIPVYGYIVIAYDGSGTSYTENKSGATSYADSKENPWVYSTTGTNKYSIYATYTPTPAGGTNYGSDGGASSGINMESQIIQ